MASPIRTIMVEGALLRKIDNGEIHLKVSSLGRALQDDVNMGRIHVAPSMIFTITERSHAGGVADARIGDLLRIDAIVHVNRENRITTANVQKARIIWANY